MPTSSLVVTLAAPVASSGPLLRYLGSCAELTVGQASGRRLPVVLDTETLSEAASWVEALGRRADVSRVDLVAVEFSDAFEPARCNS